MNHTYRLIWDEARGAFVAVAEISCRRGKRAGAVVLAAAAFLGTVPLCAFAQSAGALPTDGHVVSGHAQVDQHGSRMTVRQDSQRLIMNWGGFDIGSGAGVHFEQPNRDAVALNRVLGTSPSMIAGELTANGQVWLVNPNGVYFGKGAQVDVAGLVVSSLSVSDEDFLAGRARFAASGTAGQVRNDGRINAGDGVVALLAPSVANTGHISAAQVGMAAGDTVALDFDADGLLSLQVQRGALEAELRHGGLIQGGNVVMTAHAASALRSSVINLDGVVEATTLREQGGRIVLDAGEHGVVEMGGRLDASSRDGAGGRISITGRDLSLDGNAALDASGATGGGTIHVGGGWQGADPALLNATTVEVAAGARVDASATGAGDGGEVVFWSDGDIRFAGQIAVRGGARDGDGGRAEVSGKQTLSYSGRTDARAAHGRTGDLLLDPATITVLAGGTGTDSIGDTTVYVADLEAQNANVTLQADNGITFTDLSLNGGDGRLTMANNVSLRLENASQHIRFNNPDNTIEVFGSGSIYMQSGRTSTGYLTDVANLIAHGSGSNPGTLPVHDVTVVGSGTPGAGSITLFGADGITIGGSVTTNGGYVRIWADSDNASGGGMTLSSPVTTNGGNLHVSAGTSPIELNSDMILGSGRILFGSDGSYSSGSKVLNGLLSASGNVDITTAFTFGGNASIHTDGAINFGNVPVNLNTGAGVLTLRASSINWGTATLTNLSTASMRLEPYDPSVSMVLGAAGGFASAATLSKLPGIRNLTIGREDGTGTISVSGNYNFDASGSFEVVNRTLDFTAGGLSNTAGNVILTGDNINIGQAVTANGGTGKVVIRQATAANELRLGSGLDNASIGQVNAATLEVGRSDGGDLVFDSDISTSATSVHLKSGGRVTGVDGGVSANNLAITAGGGATITDDTFDFTTLALSTGGDTDIRSSTSDWGLGTVDGQVGLAIQPGRTAQVTLAAQGTLGLNSALAFNNSASVVRAHAGNGFAAGTAAVGGQSQAAVEFSLDGAGKSFALGGASGTLSGAHMARFNGLSTLRINAADDDITVGAFNVNVGRLEVTANTLIQQGAMTKGGTGGLYLDVAQGGLQLDHGISAVSGLVSLNDQAGAGIQGPGVITAGTLALRSAGQVALGGTQQVARVAADVGSLGLTNGRALAVGVVDGLTGVTATDTVDLRTTGASDLTLDAAVAAGNSSGATTAALLAAGRNFINTAGASAVVAGSGRWLVYSSTPLADTRGGLAPDFKQYNAGLGDAVLGTGNGFVHTVAPQLTLGLTGAVSKVYDGDNTATVDPATQVSVSGAINGDQVVLDIAGPATYDNRNVGTSKAVTVAGITVDGVSNGTEIVYGYGLASNSASGNVGTITPKQLQLAAGVVQDKVYDGNTDATVGTLELDGVVSGDDVSAGGPVTAQFVDRNAGNAKQVNLGGLTLGGTDAGNYQVSTTTAASIARRQLQAVVQVDDKVYDGNTLAHVSSQALDAAVAGDDVALDITAGNFADKNAGSNKAVTLTGALSGLDAANYTLAPASMNTTASITPKTVTEGTLSVATKVYDGTRAAQVGSSGLVGVVWGDNLGLIADGQFRDKNAGSGKTVDVDLSLAGTDAGNYVLARTSAQVTGDITRKALDAGALDVATKVYDGTRNVQVTSATPSGVVAGDNLFVDVDGMFLDKNAGVGKAVDVQLALRGSDAGNYSLTADTVRTVGTITPRTVDAGQLSVATKVYDATRDAQVSSSGMQGVVSGDSISLGLQGQFEDKNAGLGKRVDVQLALGGADAGNYRLDSATVQAVGDITPRTVQAGGALSVAPKVYDATRDAQVSGGTLQGVLAGDDLALELDGRFVDKNAGTGKVVDVDLTLAGPDAGNYQLEHATATGTGDITPRDLEAGQATAVDKPYDGTRNAAVVLPSLDGVLPGDNVALQGGGQFDDMTPAADKPVRIELSLGGTDAGNYRLLNAQQQGSATISSPPTLGAVDALLPSLTGANGTQPGNNGNIGGGGGPGAVIAAAGAAPDPSGSARPQLPDSGFDLVGGAGGSGQGASGSGQGAGGSGQGAGGSGQGAGGSGSAGGQGGAGSTGVAAGTTDGTTGTQPAGGSGVTDAGAGATGADAGGQGGAQGADGPQGGRAGSGTSTLVMEQLLRNGDGVSVSLGGEPLAEPQVSTLPVFLEEQGQFVGQYRVADSGDSLALHPMQGGQIEAPRLQQPVRASYRVQVQVEGEDDAVWLQLELLEDGTLRVTAPRAAAQLGQDVLGTYGLTALKRLGGVAPQQVRMLVLRFQD